MPGAPGKKGETGTQGEKGQRGDPGEPGKVGPAGQKGEPGPQGKTGLTGQQGLKGDTGDRGTNGEKGFTGQVCSTPAVRNCKDLLDKGHIFSDVYTICPDGRTPLTVLCDMHTDGGGWIVFQRRWDGSVDFYRDWKSYKTGFGNLWNEFWLGNDNLHQLTSSGKWELRVDLEDFNLLKLFAKYPSFKILSEAEKYKILVGDLKEGNIYDAMKIHNNALFNTHDQDNEEKQGTCAKSYKAGWWFINCYNANLNGVYKLPKETDSMVGVEWATNGKRISYKHSEMKIRPI
ncbi:ryncolin-1-like [Rana temporaria]|uniref:ryncolin-1-like n=1 Tax=Rana temporaria TaxID=8407 RepID=UPI001AADF219|nr:ryncolin-1-like [Rana temporaria]